MPFARHKDLTRRPTGAGLAIVLPLLCSGCFLLGNPCGSKSHSEQQLNHSEDIDIGKIAAKQGDGTWLVAPVDCVEVCEQFGEGYDGLELLELDSCELSLHPVLEDPSRIDDFGNARDWTRVDAIEEPISVAAEWVADETIVIAHCPGRYRVEC